MFCHDCAFSGWSCWCWCCVFCEEFDTDRESESWSASGSGSAFQLSSGSEMGSAHTGGAYAYGDSQRQRTNTRQAASSVAFFLLSWRCPRSVHQRSSSPEDVDASNHSCESATPSASASISAFAFASRTCEDGSISTSAMSYIGSGASFFMDGRNSTDAGDGEGEFRVSSIWIWL